MRSLHTAFSASLKQLQNGAGSRTGYLTSSSSSSALRTGGTVSTDHAGDIHITRPAARVESAPAYSDWSLPLCNPSSLTQPAEDPTWRSQGGSRADHQRQLCRDMPQGEEADLGGVKRKLPSPEGAARQIALPQPFTGRDRREEEEDEMEQLARGRGDGAVQSSESHMLQERQEQKGYLREELHYTDSHKSKNISAGKSDRQLVYCFLYFKYIIYCFLQMSHLDVRFVCVLPDIICFSHVFFPPH